VEKGAVPEGQLETVQMLKVTVVELVEYCSDPPDVLTQEVGTVAVAVGLPEQSAAA